MTLTSTYDHRVIQGAQSGEFLKRAAPAAARRGRLLRRDLPLAAHPLRADPLGPATSRRPTTTRSASRRRILELIHAYRVRGHMMADTDPLEYRQRSHPDLEVESHGLTLWDLDREFATGSFGG